MVPARLECTVQEIDRRVRRLRRKPEPGWSPPPTRASLSASRSGSVCGHPPSQVG